MKRNLYLSGWSPKGIRKAWERSALDNKDVQEFLGQYASDHKVKDCCAWFDQNGALRVIVADTDAPERIIYRRTARGANLEFTKIPEAA